MALDIAVVMDPIASINIKKDSTFALLLEGQRRGHRLFYVIPDGLGLNGSRAVGTVAALKVRDTAGQHFELGNIEQHPLAHFDVILLRKDPPFDSQYLYDTLILEQAQQEGVLVVNDPRGLRDLNEKLAALRFPQCGPPTIVSRQQNILSRFIAEQGDTVLKPLDGMGGRSIFRVRAGEDNLKVIIETLTANGTRLAMAQRYLPEILNGDKRILLIDGEPVPYCLARIPPKDDFRGNLAVGGRGEGRPLTERDHWIAAQAGPELRRRGMLLAGLDVIGDWLTEINVTSPTGLRELDAQFGLNIAGLLFDRIEQLRGAAPAANG